MSKKNFEHLVISIGNFKFEFNSPSWFSVLILSIIMISFYFFIK